ncbi:MAG: hypothetical protein AB7V77_02700 [Candidatus Woesearchaeota archaeon]
MVKIQFKQKCNKCKINYVMTTKKQPYVICYECQKEELNKEITDPFVKKILDIPEEYYKQNAFLRNIKINYIKYGTISEKQISAFKKTVEEMKKEIK